MEISRRRLLEIGLLQAGWSVTAKASGAISLAETHRPSIIQGPTDETRTQFSILHSRRQSFNIFVQDENYQTWWPEDVKTLQHSGQDDQVTQVFFSQLHLGGSFNLVIEDKRTQILADRRQFRMLDLNSHQLRFAVCSCMADNYHSADIWTDLFNKNPDFILFAGDSTYCDMGDSPYSGETRLWHRFSQARRTLHAYFNHRLVPIFATWDDHDFGKNDAGKDFPYAEASRENFLSFFPMNSDYCRLYQRGPGVSSSFKIASQQFILMDDRSFRVSGFSLEPYAHWGKDQEEWMIRLIESHTGPTWIINGSQMFPQMIFKQSFSKEHPIQFQRLRERLSQIQQKVIFVSGDVHFSEISEIEEQDLGYRTYELTSSSMHTPNFPGTPGLIWNSRRLAATSNRNYLLIDSEAKIMGSNFEVQSCSAHGEINFRLNLSV